MKKKTSIKRNLDLLTLWIPSAALGTALMALVLINSAEERNNLALDLAILSKLTAINASGSLVFLDNDSAHELLYSLSAHPSIMIGCLYDSGGNVFAAYLSKKIDNLSCFPTMENSNTLSGVPYLSHIQPVVLDTETVGFVEILIELETFEAQVKKFGYATLFIFLCTLLGIFLLSKRLQRIITFPFAS